MHVRISSGINRLKERLPLSCKAISLRRLIQVACLFVFLFLLFYTCWPYGSPDYAQNLRRKEWMPAEIFLMLDPLLSISTVLASKIIIPALLCALMMLMINLLFPRFFCGYVCPLGTLIDLLDDVISKRFTRYWIKRRGWWIHLKYYLLAGLLTASLFGVLFTGFFAAIPVITRGLCFTLGQLQIIVLKGAYLVPPLYFEQWLSICLFFTIFALSILQPRFWCRYICPTGAIFSLTHRFRLRERRVMESCRDCGMCKAACPFDAIQSDYSTRTSDCTLCRTCASACPVNSIRYPTRKTFEDSEPDPPPILLDEPAYSRRGFLWSVLTGSVCAVGMKHAGVAQNNSGLYPVRPPGSVPETQFLQLCIRCGECYQACPNNVLQPLGFSKGLDGLWTPITKFNWSGCEPKCNNCGQVCPTGAIRALPIDEKEAARIGLAELNLQTCLPHAQREACQLCVNECNAAGYHAIEFQRVGTQIDALGDPIEGSGFLAPVVLSDKCVGCGLCQTRCFKVNVQHKRLLEDTAIQVVAGPGKEDRILNGSYRALLNSRSKNKTVNSPGSTNSIRDDYLPDFLK